MGNKYILCMALVIGVFTAGFAGEKSSVVEKTFEVNVGEMFFPHVTTPPHTTIADHFHINKRGEMDSTDRTSRLVCIETNPAPYCKTKFADPPLTSNRLTFKHDSVNSLDDLSPCGDGFVLQGGRGSYQRCVKAKRCNTIELVVKGAFTFQRYLNIIRLHNGNEQECEQVNGPYRPIARHPKVVNGVQVKVGDVLQYEDKIDAPVVGSSRSRYPTHGSQGGDPNLRTKYIVGGVSL